MGAIAGVALVRIPLVGRSGRLRGYTAEVAPLRTGRLWRRRWVASSLRCVGSFRGFSGGGQGPSGSHGSGLLRGHPQAVLLGLDRQRYGHAFSGGGGFRHMGRRAGLQILAVFKGGCFDRAGVQNGYGRASLGLLRLRPGEGAAEPAHLLVTSIPWIGVVIERAHPSGEAIVSVQQPATAGFRFS